MKIQDIITFKKGNTNPKNKGNWNYENQTLQNYEKKHGYYWIVPSHSTHQSVLLNNYERDCIVAYIDNKYFTLFLMKMRGKDNYRAFIYKKELLSEVLGGLEYKISQVWNNKITLKTFQAEEKNIHIIDKTEYSRFKKLLLFEEIENN